MSEKKEYKVSVVNGSRDFTGREILKYTDLSEAIDISEEASAEPIVITPVDYLVVSVDSPKVEESYEKLVIIAKDGNYYKTGSKTAIRDFLNIWEQLVTNTPEEEYEQFDVKFALKDSANYGKPFVKCTVI